jgi:PAS domain S-box-containing protein
MAAQENYVPPAASLNYAEWLFLNLVENVEEYAIFAMNAEGHIVHWNRGATHITGYEEADVLGSSLDRIFTPEDCAAGAPAQELEAAAKLGRAADERWHVRKDGSRFWAFGVVVPIKDRGGKIIGFGKILRDRTDLKQMQEKLQRHNEALRQHDEGRKRFLATLAHELRNPLSVVFASTRLLRQQSKDNAAAMTEVERVERQIGHVRRLINDLADLSRVERGKFEIEKKRVDLRTIARQSCEAVAPLMNERRHDVTVLLPEIATEIMGDETRLHQIFVNLLTNAARYTPAGGRIGLTLQIEGNEVVARVEDSGIGIPPARLADIFELFTQVHTDYSEASAGLGIGLNLTRELVTAHGGTIQVISEGAGKGSRFTVRLPLA